MTTAPTSYSPPPPDHSTTVAFLRVCRAVVWVIYAIVVVNAIILSLAFVLRLLGANPEAGFTEWVYRSASRTMGPFRGMFPEQAVGDASVLDTSLLFAAAVYIVVALFIDALLRWLSRRVVAEQRATANHWRAAGGVPAGGAPGAAPWSGDPAHNPPGQNQPGW